MTKYAQYSPDAPHYVIGFYDTDSTDYGAGLPSLDTMVVVTDTQWATLMSTPQSPQQWLVAAGAMVAAPVSGPGLLAQSQAALALRLAQGIAITSDGAPGVNATYALDATSTAQIFQIGLYASQFGVFPSGQATQQYPDINGVFHSFTVPVFVAFLKAVAALTSALNMQQALMAQGGTPAWPAQIAPI